MVGQQLEGTHAEMNSEEPDGGGVGSGCGEGARGIIHLVIWRELVGFVASTRVWLSAGSSALTCVHICRPKNI